MLKFIYIQSTKKYSSPVLPGYLIAVMLILTACSQKSVQSHWAEQAIETDGFSNDWPASAMQVNEELKLVYGVVNDEDALNVLIRFQDPQLARRISTQGFNIWFDKEKRTGIQFINYASHDLMIGRLLEGGIRQQRGVPLSEHERAQFAWREGTFQIFRDKKSRALGNNHSSGVQAAAGQENGYFCLEYRFEHTGEADQNLIIPFLDKGRIKAELEIAGLPEDVKEQLEDRLQKRFDNMRGSGDPGMGGGRGMRGGRRSGRAPGGGPGADLLERFEAQSLQIKIELAKQTKE